jgi:hypothetical protein
MAATQEASAAQRPLTAFAVQYLAGRLPALVSVRPQPGDWPGQSGLPCHVSPEPLDSPQVNDMRRVASIVGDDAGYPAPRQALHGAVFPQAGEAPPALAGLFGASM